MILVQFHTVTATWDDDAREWHSDAADFAQLLNDVRPLEAMGRIESPFLIGGIQGIALRAARKVFGKDLVVLKRTHAPHPPEEPGVVSEVEDATA